MNPNDPFGCPFSPGEEIDEVVTGSWYRDTYKKEITDKGLSPQDHMVIGVILYIDKTPIDALGHFSLEPVSMSLTIFNRSTRNQPGAWRQLGFIPVFHRSKKETARVYARYKHNQTRNFHTMLEPILN